jgi:hypothetical protein
MKKVFTFLVALGGFAVAQAQYSHGYPDDHNRDRDVVLGQGHESVYDNHSRYAYSFSERDRDKQIDRINRDYDRQIRRIERDRWMSPYDKNFQIRRLEDQRREEIRIVWDRFRSSNNIYANGRYPQNNRRW